MTAFFRLKEMDYNRGSNEEVWEESNKDIAYWTNNFSRLTKVLEPNK
jgi:hypothetical protein